MITRGVDGRRPTTARIFPAIRFLGALQGRVRLELPTGSRLTLDGLTAPRPCSFSSGASPPVSASPTFRTGPKGTFRNPIERAASSPSCRKVSGLFCPALPLHPIRPALVFRRRFVPMPWERPLRRELPRRRAAPRHGPRRPAAEREGDSRRDEGQMALQRAPRRKKGRRRRGGRHRGRARVLRLYRSPRLGATNRPAPRKLLRAALLARGGAASGRHPGDPRSYGSWIARHEGRALAAIVTLFRGEDAVYLYGASSDEKRNLMPAYALQWAAMRAAKAAGCRLL